MEHMGTDRARARDLRGHGGQVRGRGADSTDSCSRSDPGRPPTAGRGRSWWFRRGSRDLMNGSGSRVERSRGHHPRAGDLARDRRDLAHDQRRGRPDPRGRAASAGRSPSVPTTLRSSGVVAHMTSAAGSSAGRPAATSAAQIPGRRPAAINSTRVSTAVGDRAQIRRAVAVGGRRGDHRERAGHVAVGDGDPRGGRRRGRARHAGHHLHGDAGRRAREHLLAASAEHERVAALQPDDRRAPRAHARRAAR